MVKWPIIRRLTATFVLLLFVVLVNAEVTYNCTVKLIEAQNIAFDSERAIAQLERIISSFKDIEILEGQYLLTKNVHKLNETSFVIHRDILEYIQNLHELTLERPQLQQKIEIIKRQISNNFNLLVSDINSVQKNLNPQTDLENLNFSGNYSPNQSIKQTLLGENIQQLIQNMEVEEENLLKQHINQLHKSLQRIFVIFWITIVVDLSLVVLLYYFFKNYISQLQETEITRKLRDSKTRERANLLDIAIDAISLQNICEEILYWNQGAENLYGWTSPEVVGKHISKVLDTKALAQQKQALGIVLEQGEWRGELTQVSKNGKEITVESSWTLVRDESGKPKSILTIDREITRKKELEAQLLRSQRLESIGTLAGGIAHDLNNILAPILMSVQLLQMRLNDEQNQQLLKTLEKNVQRG
nr:PAS domain S-box protein [Mastigocoleus sp. MO_167.B18]